jgi:GT2 family glycosyltransferase
MDKDENMNFHVLVININNLSYTKNCINDLLNQNTKEFDILIVDNGSTEPGTKEYFNSLLSNKSIKVIYNATNIGVNRVWDDFGLHNSGYLCFLNNDVRLTQNFIKDTYEIMLREHLVGVINHPSNNMKYANSLNGLKYDVILDRYKQGWDFTIRAELYKKIPDEIKVYCGDDWIFHNIYEAGYVGCMAVSSPIIHYQGKSTQYGFKVVPGPANSDFKIYTERLKLPHYLRHLPHYSNIKPTFTEIK